MRASLILKIPTSSSSMLLMAASWTSSLNPAREKPMVSILKLCRLKFCWYFIGLRLLLILCRKNYLCSFSSFLFKNKSSLQKLKGWLTVMTGSQTKSGLPRPGALVFALGVLLAFRFNILDCLRTSPLCLPLCPCSLISASKSWK